MSVSGSDDGNRVPAEVRTGIGGEPISASQRLQGLEDGGKGHVSGRLQVDEQVERLVAGRVEDAILLARLHEMSAWVLAMQRVENRLDVERLKRARLGQSGGLVANLDRVSGVYSFGQSLNVRIECH